MTTYKRTNCMISAMEAAVEEAILNTGAPLEDVQAQIQEVRDRFNANPDTVSEADLLDAAEMLGGFLQQSYRNISRFFKALDRTAVIVTENVYADGSWLANGEVAAL